MNFLKNLFKKLVKTPKIIVPKDETVHKATGAVLQEYARTFKDLAPYDRGEKIFQD